MKPIYKTITIKKVVAYCPKCNRALHRIDRAGEPDVATIMLYYCESCNYAY